MSKKSESEMITIYCEKTGLSFQAPNRRKSTHPTVTAWLLQAYKEGWYQQANHAIYGNSTSEVEKIRFTSIEHFEEYFKQLREQALAENERRERERQERERDLKAARQDRVVTNTILRRHGYGWANVGFRDEEDADFTNFNAVEIGSDWRLFSPDKRPVSVRQAMEELAKQGVQVARTWLADHQLPVPEAGKPEPPSCSPQQVLFEQYKRLFEEAAERQAQDDYLLNKQQQKVLQSMSLQSQAAAQSRTYSATQAIAEGVNVYNLTVAYTSRYYSVYASLEKRDF